MKYQKLIINDLIKARVKTSRDLDSFKRKISKKYKITFTSNIQLLKAYHKILKDKGIKRSKTIESLLITSPVRSLSGIVNVSILTKEYPCPGKCIYCPQEKGIPKSYISGEPAVERAKSLDYCPYGQTKERITMLEDQGHPVDKIDLRIIGGTWSFYPKQYQTWFIKRCFDACNNKKSKTLLEAQRLNEKSKHRIIGLSIETRPDFINEKEIKRLRKLGVTKVEIGVQSISDKVLKLNKRDHGVKATIKATQLLKDAGFKVSYQAMLNLLGSTPKKDLKEFQELFGNPDFKPDLLKIYPCALLKGTPLYRLYLKKQYRPYSMKELSETIKEIKKIAPYYVRIERIIRDIPSQKIVTGPTKVSNLRQIVQKEMREEGWQCKCIRCREIKDRFDRKDKLYLFRDDYDSSGGREIFLSFENKNRSKLYSLLKLRIPSFYFQKTKHFIKALQDSSIVRELHTYGQLTPISKKGHFSQHKGLGKKLIKEAEKITRKEFNLKKIAIISGIGVREYYRKRDYELKENYMLKNY